MNNRTAKRWAKKAEPENIRAAFLREVKRLNKSLWARTICTVVPDGPSHVYLSATAVPWPQGHRKVQQALYKGRKP